MYAHDDGRQYECIILRTSPGRSKKHSFPFADHLRGVPLLRELCLLEDQFGLATVALLGAVVRKSVTLVDTVGGFVMMSARILG